MLTIAHLALLLYLLLILLCKAMDEELQAIKKNETWDLVELPEEKNVIGLKWVYRTKHHANGKIQMFKARLVTKGHA